MKDLHIIFNIDYKGKNQSNFFRESLVRQIRENTIELPTFDQFKLLISVLNNDVRCFLWIHPSLGSELVDEQGIDSEIMSKVVPELLIIGLDFKKITRTAMSGTSDIENVNKMPFLIQTMTSYTAKELKQLVFNPIVVAQVVTLKRQRLVDTYKDDIRAINANLSNLRTYLNKYVIGNLNWNELLFSHILLIPDNIFHDKFWKFPAKIFIDFLNIKNIEQGVIDISLDDVSDGIKYDMKTRKWIIDYSFFDQVSQRFEMLNREYKKDLQIATNLFLFHEIVHKVHNLDSNTVEGIGNYPRIVEDVDYQADTISILTEITIFISMNNGIDGASAKKIICKTLETIRVAVETTFSFNPINYGDGLIQIRRVNRYLIWLFQYIQIERLYLIDSQSTETLMSILEILSTKPIIEISGPAIESNSTYNRTFYNLNFIHHLESLSYIGKNNQIVRIGKTENSNFSKLYEGFKKSNFNELYEFLNSILVNTHS